MEGEEGGEEKKRKKRKRGEMKGGRREEGGMVKAASFPGSLSFCAIIPRITFDPPESQLHLYQMYGATLVM